jgi:magnesium-transporting ATPase (P-type)
MSAFQALMLASQLAVPLALIPGLWIAVRWRVDVNAWLSGIGTPVATSRVGQLIVWIGLGVLFANPFMDLLAALFSVLQLFVRPAGEPGTMSTVWGQGSFLVYSGISTLMTLAIYALVVWVGYRLWPEAETEDEGVMTKNPLAVEEWFVLLAVASLVNRFVLAVVQSIIWLPVPSSVDMGRLSSVGFFGAWLIGLAVLAVILLVLFNSVRKHQSTS